MLGGSIMAKVIFNEERCKGCELCTLVCPVKIVIAAWALYVAPLGDGE